MDATLSPIEYDSNFTQTKKRINIPKAATECRQLLVLCYKSIFRFQLVLNVSCTNLRDACKLVSWELNLTLTFYLSLFLFTKKSLRWSSQAKSTVLMVLRSRQKWSKLSLLYPCHWHRRFPTLPEILTTHLLWYNISFYTFLRLPMLSLWRSMPYPLIPHSSSCRRILVSLYRVCKETNQYLRNILTYGTYILSTILLETVCLYVYSTRAQSTIFTRTVICQKSMFSIHSKMLTHKIWVHIQPTCQNKHS